MVTVGNFYKKIVTVTVFHMSKLPSGIGPS
jgi:hypothetical protein